MASDQDNTEWSTAVSVPPERIRNVCVLAHVDHGKTSLTDSLVSSNGIISSRLAGKVRYMDSRQDEQIRGITMKSSAISLSYSNPSSGIKYLVNVVDSPGHIDFTGEVETALRICDGAILVVDVVEGVCVQTVSVLRAALEYGIRPVLVLNKVDRLFVELRMDPMQAFHRIARTIEQVNVVMGLRMAQLMMLREQDPDSNVRDATEWTVDLEEEESGSGFFSPEKGNVIFCSAIDRWAFGLEYFADLYSKKFGLSKNVLTKTLWGDYYVLGKAKRIVRKRGLPEGKRKGAKPMFVQFVVENIWSVYDAFLGESASIDRQNRIVTQLSLQVHARDMNGKDRLSAFRAVMSAWLPVAPTILGAVVAKLPNPREAQVVRMPILWPYSVSEEDETFSAWQRMKEVLMRCDGSNKAPTIAFVTKMVSRERKDATAKISIPRPRDAGPISETRPSDEEPDTSSETIAIVRLFSGCIRPNDALFVYSPRFKTGSDVNYSSDVVIPKVCLLLGRDTAPIDRVDAGMVCGLYGLEDQVLKTAMLSSIPPDQFFPMLGVNRSAALSSTSLVRVAIEPHNALEMNRLQEGLRRLNQADPAVETYVMENGELVLAASGELHLERCLKDLREQYAKIRIEVSAPIVAFMETVAGLDTENRAGSCPFPCGKQVTVTTANQVLTVRLRAVGLPRKFGLELDQRAVRERTFISANRTVEEMDTQYSEIYDALLSDLEAEPWHKEKSTILTTLSHTIVDLGPRKFGSNLLLRNPLVEENIPLRRHALSNYIRFKASDYGEAQNDNVQQAKDLRHEGDSSILDVQDRVRQETAKGILTGFQLAVQAGPLCEEPMHGVGIILEEIIFDWDELPEQGISDKFGPFSGQVISCIREGCRLAFLSASPRLVEPMLRLDIQATSDALGSTYGVISKRRGTILSEDMREGSPLFFIEALLPVSESFGFTDILRKQTSGSAQPQMTFSHWETIEEDPFWVPSTEDELEDLGLEDTTQISNNLARKLMNRTRRRKGLKVEEKIVEKAEKQRTLSKKK